MENDEKSVYYSSYSGSDIVIMLEENVCSQAYGYSISEEKGEKIIKLTFAIFEKIPDVLKNFDVIYILFCNEYGEKALQKITNLKYRKQEYGFSIDSIVHNITVSYEYDINTGIEKCKDIPIVAALIDRLKMIAQDNTEMMNRKKENDARLKKIDEKLGKYYIKRDDNMNIVNRFTLADATKGKIDISVYPCDKDVWYYNLQEKEIEVAMEGPTHYKIVSGEYKDKTIPAVHLRIKR